jgi:chemotaxis protein histidine kinase CheA
VGSDNAQVVKFFILEANEHLDAMDEALKDLQATVEDYESCNTVYRAAHTIKGGAAMLGFESIRRLSLLLENCFKYLREHPIPMNERCQRDFTTGITLLRSFIKVLEAGTYDDANLSGRVDAVDGPLTDLYEYIKTEGSDGGVPADFAAKVMTGLKQMVVLFKQPPSPASRQKLVQICDQLGKLAEKCEPWQAMVMTASGAIANPRVGFAPLAPHILKELKQASELIAAGRESSVVPSATLQKLAVVPPAPAAPAPAAPAPAPAAPAPAAAAPKQITIPLDPKGAARAIIGAFRKDQLMELAKYLAMASRQ